MILQDNTKNKSFLKLSYILREMGIENNSFFLRLYDESLYDLDPFKYEHLSLEQIIRIRVEISRNFWYYIREISRVPDSADGFFELHRGNLALYTMLNLDFNCIFLTPRQCYKTTSSMKWYEWLLDYGGTNTNVGLFTLSEKLSSNNLSRYKILRDAVPPYLRVKNKKDIDNATSIKVVTENSSNSISTKAVGTSEDAAEDSARGFSYQCLVYDEFAFINFIEKHYSTSIHAYATAARAAEAKGGRHHILLTTTAGHLYKPSGKWAYNLIQRSAPFHEKIYDMTYTDSEGILQFDREQIANYIVAQSDSKSAFSAFVAIQYEYFELGKPDDYLETQRELCQNDSDPTAFEREVLMKWQTQSGDHPLGKERIERLRDNIKKPNSILVIDNLYFLNIYRERIEKDIPYILGVDCSGNLQKDFSTVVAIDPTNFEVVATMRINSHSVIRFGGAICYIMHNLMPRSIVLIERNGVGIGVVDYVLGKIGPARVWRDEKENYGVAATKDTRDLLYGNVLKVAAMNYYDKIHDTHIINETILLEYDNRGRVNHPKDGHDDTLMAYLWAMWFLLHAKNRSKYIDSIYIGLNLDNQYTSEEIGEKIMDNEKNMYQQFNRNSIHQKKEILLDGSDTPEALFLKQQKMLSGYNDINQYQSNTTDKYSYLKMLKSIKDEQMEKEFTHGMNVEKYDAENINQVEKLQEKDVEYIDQETEKKRLQEKKEKVWRSINYNSFKGNSPFPF